MQFQIYPLETRPASLETRPADKESAVPQRVPACIFGTRLDTTSTCAAPTLPPLRSRWTNTSHPASFFTAKWFTHEKLHALYN